jgi:hypothetical protein
MFRELDVVVLTHDIAGFGLKRGDLGTIVHVYGAGEAYEVEFATAEAKTIALLTLTVEDIRPMGAGEILHARDLAQAS